MNLEKPESNGTLTFLGTGGAWGSPELHCDCRICREMRHRGEKRDRAALLLTARTRLLLDCGPDIRSQLIRNRVGPIHGVLISHEHGDHYLGLDDLFAYKRNMPRADHEPIPVFLTAESWEVIGRRFAYLEAMGVVRIRTVRPGHWFEHHEFRILPFKTEHGAFARGSVGFLVRYPSHSGPGNLVYTSDFFSLPEVPDDIRQPDELVIQSFWLNEPVRNTPRHMSFQRALEFIETLAPRKTTYLIHLGDGDFVPGDPANRNAKKIPPQAPMAAPDGPTPYPIPLHHAAWQHTVEQILADRGLPYRVTVAYDDLCVQLAQSAERAAQSAECGVHGAGRKV